MIPENALFTILIVTNPVLILAGLALYKFPPKKINHIYGYRTKRSMRSQEAWDFSQTLGGLYLLRGAAISSILIPVSLFVNLSAEMGFAIGIGLALIQSIIPIYLVEKALKAKFG